MLAAAPGQPRMRSATIRQPTAVGAWGWRPCGELSPGSPLSSLALILLPAGYWGAS